MSSANSPSPGATVVSRSNGRVRRIGSPSPAVTTSVASYSPGGTSSTGKRAWAAAAPFASAPGSTCPSAPVSTSPVVRSVTSTRTRTASGATPFATRRSAYAWNGTATVCAGGGAEAAVTGERREDQAAEGDAATRCEPHFEPVLQAALPPAAVDGRETNLVRARGQLDQAVVLQRRRHPRHHRAKPCLLVAVAHDLALLVGDDEAERHVVWGTRRPAQFAAKHHAHASLVAARQRVGCELQGQLRSEQGCAEQGRDLFLRGGRSARVSE